VTEAEETLRVTEAEETLRVTTVCHSEQTVCHSERSEESLSALRPFTAFRVTEAEETLSTVCWKPKKRSVPCVQN